MLSVTVTSVSDNPQGSYSLCYVLPLLVLVSRLTSRHPLTGRWASASQPLRANTPPYRQARGLSKCHLNVKKGRTHAFFKNNQLQFEARFQTHVVSFTPLVYLAKSERTITNAH